MENYRRFYASFNKLPRLGDPEDAKEAIVSSYTSGRTTSLREMTPQEYDACCRDLEAKVNPDSRQQFLLERRRKRSMALHQLQLYGINTADWARVNAFCADRRIAGKPFGQLNINELEALTVKMRAINGKRDKQN